MLSPEEYDNTLPLRMYEGKYPEQVTIGQDDVFGLIIRFNNFSNLNYYIHSKNCDGRTLEITPKKFAEYFTGWQGKEYSELFSKFDEIFDKAQKTEYTHFRKLC